MIIFYLFLAVWLLELRTLHLLGRCHPLEPCPQSFLLQLFFRQGFYPTYCLVGIFGTGHHSQLGEGVVVSDFLLTTTSACSTCHVDGITGVHHCVGSIVYFLKQDSEVVAEW
jgi:hypothetical protein